MVASQRRLERKLKELNMTLDEERQMHTEQKDQVFTLTSDCMSTFEQENVSTSNKCDLILFYSLF